ncbi:hypothetical protein PYW08_008429 [Mythimna loreyi]|uniref:Uncharacterized protein n=1 Tax=Mythimna loreyi TaxID=667449 RepID=A0ACC2QDA6_9NEOP|nr:hypothetical protein PYW08_008429 [Mythimna loreyi]
MSDSSSEEDLSRFREVVDTSFTKLINESRGQTTEEDHAKNQEKPKSERYLEVSSHYNDVKVPAEMQKRIGAKVSAIIQKKLEFVDVENNIKKRKIKGGVKLFKASEGFLSCEEAKDTYTESHNEQSKKLKNKRRQINEEAKISEDDKINAVTVTGESILSKEETKLWKSRRKEKVFKYKGNKKSKVLTEVL